MSRGHWWGRELFPSLLLLLQVLVWTHYSETFPYDLLLRDHVPKSGYISRDHLCSKAIGCSMQEDGHIILQQFAKNLSDEFVHMYTLMLILNGKLCTCTNSLIKSHRTFLQDPEKPCTVRKDPPTTPCTRPLFYGEVMYLLVLLLLHALSELLRFRSQFLAVQCWKMLTTSAIH